MNYNTQRGKLQIREYGRHIQNLIGETKKIKDKKERSDTAAVIVNLMEMLRPALRNVEEYRHKLWDHFYVIAGEDIDIDSPFGFPTDEEIKLESKPMAYPEKSIQYKHYGINVETLVKKAMGFEDPEKLQYFLNIIGSYMKLVSRNRNKDATNDEIIKQDLAHLSGGQFTFEHEVDFDLLIRTVRQTTRRPQRKDYKKSNYKKKSRRQGSNR